MAPKDSFKSLWKKRTNLNIVFDLLHKESQQGNGARVFMAKEGIDSLSAVVVIFVKSSLMVFDQTKKEKRYDQI